MGEPPPLLHLPTLDLGNVRRLAEEYDTISQADGRHWPAVAFVEWQRDEQRASAELTEQRVKSAAA